MRLIALDFDGTLADSKHNIMYAVHKACQAMGVPTPNLSQVMQLTGLKLEDAMKRLNPNITPTEQTAWIQKFCHYAEQQNDAHMPPEVLFANVINTLDILNDDNTFLAVVTGKGRNSLNISMRTHNLADYFVVTKTADDGPGKPNPTVLLDAMHELGVNPCDTVMVGDTTFDILTGKNAGTKTIGVSYGNHTVAQLTNAGADIIIDTIAELPPAINKVLQ